MYIHSLFIVPFSDFTPCSLYTVHIVNANTRIESTARSVLSRAPRVYFCNFVFWLDPISACSASHSVRINKGKPVLGCRYHHVHAIDSPPTDAFDGDSSDYTFHLTLWESALRASRLLAYTNVHHILAALGIIYWLSLNVSPELRTVSLIRPERVWHFRIDPKPVNTYIFCIFQLLVTHILTFTRNFTFNNKTSLINL